MILTKLSSNFFHLFFNKIFLFIYNNMLIFYCLFFLTDPLYNNCEAPEQDYQSLEFVFNRFTEGSIVWAKMGGYPW